MNTSEDAEDVVEELQAITHGLCRLLTGAAEELRTKTHPDSQERHAILIYSALRASRTGSAALLLSNRAFAEEIGALNRGLAEVCINAAYLQIASELELDNYLSRDVPALASRIQRMQSALPRKDRGSAAESAKLRDLTSQSGALTQDGWSNKKVMLRAKETDSFLKSSLMVPLALFVYEAGHTHVHGTALSVAGVGNWFLDGAKEDSEGRVAATTAALNGTACCLYSLISFIAARYPLGIESEVLTYKQRLSSVA